MAVKQPITIVGCGPGARECITMEALAAIEGAEVAIGAARLLKMFPDIKAERVAVRGYREETVAAVKQNVGRHIAVLVTGDPGLASLAAAVIESFGIESCRVLPGISSVQVAFARLGLSWEGARILSAHAAEPALSFNALSAEQTIAVLAGNSRSIQWITSLGRGLGESWRIFVAQDLTLNTERVFETSADELGKLPHPSRAVVVFCRKSKL